MEQREQSATDKATVEQLRRVYQNKTRVEHECSRVEKRTVQHSREERNTIAAEQKEKIKTQ